MQNKHTRKFFNSEFIIKNKLSFSTVIILQDIYFWILSNNPPKSIIKNSKTYYYLSQSHFAELNYGLLNQSAINHIFTKLKEIKIIDSNFIENGKQNYISLNWNVVKESLLCEDELMEISSNEWWKKIHAYADKQIKMEKEGFIDSSYNTIEQEKKDMLFDVNENKLSYSENSYRIIVRIIEKCKKEKYSFFNHKYNAYGENQTKLFNKSCNCVESIYKGKFINHRLYPLSEKFKTNQQFPLDMDLINSKLKSVEGDWVKVKKLIFECLENFIKMHQDDFVPCDKHYLSNSLNDWFYGYSDEAGRYQSQFLLSFKEPDKTSKFFSEKKADRIYETLSPKVQEKGNKLIDLLPKGNSSGKYWENIKEIVEWGKLVLTCDENAKYWIEKPSDILDKLYDYFIQMNIQVSNNTLDIQKQIECSGPWVWFIQNAIENHSLNRGLIDCVNNEDFIDCYKTNKNIGFDDMDEIPVF